MDIKSGDRKWHRIFGWGTINRYHGGETCLFDSDYKHIQQHVMGKGWIDYIGTGENGNIVTIHMKASELFDAEQNDRQQGLIKMLVKVIS